MLTLCRPIHCVHKKEASSFLVITFMWLFFIYYILHMNYAFTLTVYNSIIKFNHHTWEVLYLWCHSCDAGLLLSFLINKMPFSVSNKHLITVLLEEKQYTVREFLREFLNRKWSRGGLNHLLEKKLTYLFLSNYLLLVLLKTLSLFVNLCTVNKTTHIHHSVILIST